MMTEFTLKLKIPNAGNKEIYYSVNLTGTDRSYPEDYFNTRIDRGKANCLSLRQAIENQSLRQVTDEQLEQIIHNWNHGIKYGKSNTTTVIISLEPYGGSSQPIAPIVQPPSQPLKPKPPMDAVPKQPQSPRPENPPVSPETPPSVETWATDNQADF